MHLYGKAPRAGRKLGHVTLVDADEGRVAEVVELAAAAWHRARYISPLRSGACVAQDLDHPVVARLLCMRERRHALAVREIHVRTRLDELADDLGVRRDRRRRG